MFSGLMMWLFTVCDVSGLAMWLFRLLIWSRFVDDPLGNFIDLCSMCNVSVFVMTHRQYGHYIHGRSAHGKADVNLKAMHEFLIREEVHKEK